MLDLTTGLLTTMQLGHDAELRNSEVFTLMRKVRPQKRIKGNVPDNFRDINNGGSEKKHHDRNSPAPKQIELITPAIGHFYKDFKLVFEDSHLMSVSHTIAVLKL